MVLLSAVLLFSLSFSVSSANTANEDGLVAKYSFDNDSGTTVIDSAGNYNGTAKGTTLVSGWDGNGKARSFNGTSDYIQFNQKIIPVGEKSIKFKIKTTVKPSEPGAVFISTMESTATFGTMVGILSNGSLLFRNSKGTLGTFNFNLSSNKDISDGKWHEILVTWDGTTKEGSVKIFIDDMMTPDTVGTALKEETTSSSYNLKLGGSNTGANHSSPYYFNGQLDDIEIYSKVIEPINPSEPVQAKLYIGDKSLYKLTTEGEVFSWGGK